jgi:uncharacterized membrane protein
VPEHAALVDRESFAITESVSPYFFNDPDVQITSETIRRLTTVHGVISFFFNVAVLALTVNIVSTLM